MRLKYAYGIVPGNIATGQNPECKDKVRLFRRNDVTVITLAGSAGATGDPGSGAEEAAETAAMVVAERFDELSALEEGYIEEGIGNRIAEALREKEHVRPGTVCGLMFVAVKDNQYLAGHLGGGFIVRLDENGLALPLRETGVQNDLRIYKGRLEEPFGFMLLSEGACRSLHEAGTGNLSPACGTFFEWLKEYDGDTVSEALEENIGKYFLRDVKGDISVALLISDHDAAEPEPESADAQNTPGDKRKHRKFIKYLIVVLIVLAAVYAVALRQFDVAEKKDDQSKEESKPPVSYTDIENSYEPSVTFSAANPEAYDPGEYKAGVDIPVGEYFFWIGEMLKPDSIFVNDDSCLSGELYCMTVRLNEWDTLVSEYRFTSAENVNPVKPTEGILLSGKYKIGKDIEPGTYRVSPADQGTAGRYYSLLDEEISNDTEFMEDTTVVVPEEGYIVFYNSILFVEEK